MATSTKEVEQLVPPEAAVLVKPDVVLATPVVLASDIPVVPVVPIASDTVAVPVVPGVPAVSVAPVAPVVPAVPVAPVTPPQRQEELLKWAKSQGGHAQLQLVCDCLSLDYKFRQMSGDSEPVAYKHAQDMLPELKKKVPAELKTFYDSTQARIHNIETAPVQQMLDEELRVCPKALDKNTRELICDYLYLSLQFFQLKQKNDFPDINPVEKTKEQFKREGLLTQQAETLTEKIKQKKSQIKTLQGSIQKKIAEQQKETKADEKQQELQQQAKMLDDSMLMLFIAPGRGAVAPVLTSGPRSSQESLLNIILSDFLNALGRTADKPQEHISLMTKKAQESISIMKDEELQRYLTKVRSDADKLAQLQQLYFDFEEGLFPKRLSFLQNKAMQRKEELIVEVKPKPVESSALVGKPPVAAEIPLSTDLEHKEVELGALPPPLVSKEAVVSAPAPIPTDSFTVTKRSLLFQLSHLHETRGSQKNALVLCLVDLLYILGKAADKHEKFIAQIISMAEKSISTMEDEELQEYLAQVQDDTKSLKKLQHVYFSYTLPKFSSSYTLAQKKP